MTSLTATTPPARSTVAARAGAIEERKRVLIADDSPTYRLWLELLLEGRYEVAVANDGRAAITLAVAIPPDLILLDVIMPEMDGLAACRVLRALPETRRTPVILVTSQGEERDLEAGYSSGCTDYITKPVDPVEFLAKVESWLAAAEQYHREDA